MANTGGPTHPLEFELVKAFGVSRLIVREAIRDMENPAFSKSSAAQGGAVVQHMRHDAVTSVMRDVLNMGQAKVTDIMEVRLDIEPSWLVWPPNVRPDRTWRGFVIICSRSRKLLAINTSRGTWSFID